MLGIARGLGVIIRLFLHFQLSCASDRLIHFHAVKPDCVDEGAKEAQDNQEDVEGVKALTCHDLGRNVWKVHDQTNW